MRTNRCFRLPQPHSVGVFVKLPFFKKRKTARSSPIVQQDRKTIPKGSLRNLYPRKSLVRINVPRLRSSNHRSFSCFNTTINGDNTFTVRQNLLFIYCSLFPSSFRRLACCRSCGHGGTFVYLDDIIARLEPYETAS